MVHRSLSPCVLDIFDLRQEFCSLFFCLDISTLGGGAGVSSSSLSMSRICSVLEISTLGGRAGGFVVVVVDVDIVVSAGGGGFRPQSSRL